MNVVHTNLETGVTSPMWRLGGLFLYDGLKRVNAAEASMGDIVALYGAEDISIGDTVCDPSCVEGLPFVKISEPTVTMTFSVNDSPFAGREGQYVTRGQVIGYVGSTGWSTGPHLHLTMYYNGSLVNPKRYLP